MNPVSSPFWCPFTGLRGQPCQRVRASLWCRRPRDDRPIGRMLGHLKRYISRSRGVSFNTAGACDANCSAEPLGAQHGASVNMPRPATIGSRYHQRSASCRSI
jgi:hypothetical protein